jgi:hypothetical protein
MSCIKDPDGRSINLSGFIHLFLIVQIFLIHKDFITLLISKQRAIRLRISIRILSGSERRLSRMRNWWPGLREGSQTLPQQIGNCRRNREMGNLSLRMEGSVNVSICSFLTPGTSKNSNPYSPCHTGPLSVTILSAEIILLLQPCWI